MGVRKMLGGNLPRYQVWLFVPLLALLLVALACAPAEAPEPIVTEKEVVGEVVKEVPVEKEVVVVATPTPTPVTAPAPAGKVTIMVGDFATETFDPLTIAGSPGGLNYGRILHGFLISGNEKGEKIPGIATEWVLSADGLTWTFTIRPGVKFHDGTELTAEDVFWTFQHYFGPDALEYNTSGTFQLVSREFDKMEMIGPNKVTVTTKTPIPPLAYNLSEVEAAWSGILPRRPKLYDEAAGVAYDKKPIGAGPMWLADHIPGFLMQFERFDDYYFQPKNGFYEDRRVNFKTLDLVLAPEKATRVAAIRAGESDIAPVSLGEKKQVEAGGGRLVFSREGTYIRVRLPGANLKPEYPTYDKRVRQALEYALDKGQIQQLMGGPEVMEIRGWGAVTPSTIGYTVELDARPFNPDKARQLMADAGFPGGKGLPKLFINTFPASATPFIPESAQLAADSWRRELGLDVQVRVRDSTATKKLENAGKLNGQITWRDNETRRNSLKTIQKSYGFPNLKYRYYDDPELVALINDTAEILNPDEQEEALKKAYQRLREETYDISVGYVNISWAVGPRIATWKPWPLAAFPSALHTITLK